MPADPRDLRGGLTISSDREMRAVSIRIEALVAEMETLPDVAVRSRIDWQYALSLERTDPGFDSTVLSEFRTRLVAGAAAQRLLDALLAKCRERKWLKARGRQRTDSTHVLARVRAVNR